MIHLGQKIHASSRLERRKDSLSALQDKKVPCIDHCQADCLATSLAFWWLSNSNR